MRRAVRRDGRTDKCHSAAPVRRAIYSADHLCPAFGIGRNVGAEFRRRSQDEDDAARLEPVAHVRRAECFTACLVEEVDDGGRRPGRRKQREPRSALDPGIAGLGHGRDIRQHRHALGGRNGQAAHAAVLDVLERERHDVEHHRHATRDKVLQRRRRPFIRHVHDVGVGQETELLARDVAARADALRGEAHGAGLRSGELDQLLDRLRLDLGIDHQHVRQVGDVDDRREILGRVVG